VLVLIPGGTYKMGAQRKNPEEDNYDPHAQDEESPVREVTIPPFFLSKHECTQAQWRVLTTGTGPGEHRAEDPNGEALRLVDRNPVSMVTWTECMHWLPRNRLVLPTESQWEYACRAGTSSPWSVGSDLARLRDSANVADAKRAAGAPTRRRIVQVGGYPPNAFGLHDMHGNVNEWCRNNFYSRGFAGRNAALRDTPVFRGGSYTRSAIDARSAFRTRFPPESRAVDLGARPARPVIP